MLVKLQQANICFTNDRLPEIELDESEGGAPGDVAAVIDQVTAAIGQDAAPAEPAAGAGPLEDQSTERPPEMA